MATTLVANGLLDRPGERGFQGQMGRQGRAGERGRQGVAGTGLQGEAGLQGVSAVGLQGETGQQGVAANGVQGADGFQGIEAVGRQGEMGFQGIAANGVQGADGFQGVSAVGVQGADGFQGIEAVGRQGEMGFQGIAANGVQGERGFQGQLANGVQGADGFQGLTANGVQGADGFQGVAAIGTQGETGRQGVAATGQQGERGFQGQTGFSTVALVGGAGVFVDAVTASPNTIVSAPGYVTVGPLVSGGQYTTVAAAMAAFSAPFTATLRNQNIVIIGNTTETSALPLRSNYFIRLNAGVTWTFNAGIRLSDGVSGGHSVDIVGSDLTSIVSIDVGANSPWANLGGTGSQLTLRRLTFRNLTTGQANAWICDGNSVTSTGITAIVESVALVVSAGVNGFRNLGAGSIISDVTFAGNAANVAANLVNAQAQPMTLKNVRILGTSTISTVLPLCNVTTEAVVLDGLTSDAVATWRVLVQVNNLRNAVDPFLTLDLHGVVLNIEAQINATDCWLAALTVNNVGQGATVQNFSSYAHLRGIHLTGSLAFRRGNPGGTSANQWLHVTIADSELVSVTNDQASTVVILSASVQSTTLQNWVNPAVPTVPSVSCASLAFSGCYWINPTSGPVVEQIQTLGNSSSITITGCYFSNTHLSVISNQTLSLTVNGCVFNTAVPWTSTTMVIFISSTLVTCTRSIVNNMIYVNGALVASPTVNTFLMVSNGRNLISGNWIYTTSNPATTVISAINLGSVSFARVIGNQCVGGITHVNALSDTHIAYNVCYNLALTGVGGSGQVWVVGNRLLSAVSPAFNVTVSSSNIYAIGNLALNLVLSGAVSNSFYANNRFTLATIGGMTLSGATISNTVFANNNASSLTHASGSMTTCTISSNRFVLGTTGGMTINAPAGCTIEGNVASDMILTNPIGNTITGNRLLLSANSILFNPAGANGWNNALVGNCCGVNNIPGTINLSNFANLASRANTVVGNALCGGTPTNTTVNDQVGLNG